MPKAREYTRKYPANARNRTMTLSDEQLDWLAANPGRLNVSAVARRAVSQAMADVERTNQ